ncbi:META domain-containing protein [Porphyromonas crevioricanis]|uniref:META domain n=3 Tax=Porphyromonas crevioricanis TaxID=393921 RepID=A0A2X4PGV5_9PORP|nr:META domain-containing protein [Porphyromonas crevioricanis]GAD04339.1 hypothetical protein PORCRE_22 [Porphyromonas crevioricanis JCM 15906]GAD07762.1 hypothetical protein PORCAN_1389 [Porphyromonas crevioricanis JCM 13913]SJZ87946.1 Heat shock protein HslJ [Porphyromonas crevioricanis]SQH73136.1 META domain [Porphyromonas crevioricanis]
MNMKKIVSLSLLLLTTILLTTQCGCRKSCDQKIDGNWQVVNMNGEAIEPVHDQLTLNIEAKKKIAGGIGICNRFSCNLDTKEIKEGKIKFGEIVSTKVGCDKISYEFALFSCLEMATNYSLSGDVLVLTGDGPEGKSSITFIRKK